MYEMVAGQRPFFDPIPFAEAAKRIKDTSPPPKMFVPQLDPAWNQTICRCLEVDPKDRFDSVLQVAESLTNAGPNSYRARKLLPQGSLERVEITGRPLLRGSRRRLWVVFAALLPVVALFGIL